MNRLVLPVLLSLLFASGHATALSKVDYRCYRDLVWPFHLATVSADVVPEVLICNNLKLEQRTTNRIASGITFTTESGTPVPFELEVLHDPQDRLEIIPDAPLESGVSYTLTALDDHVLSGCNKAGRGPSTVTFTVADTPLLLEVDKTNEALLLLFSEPMEPGSVQAEVFVEGAWQAIEGLEVRGRSGADCDSCGSRVLEAPKVRGSERVRVVAATSNRGGVLDATELEFCGGLCDELAWRSGIVE